MTRIPRAPPAVHHNADLSLQRLTGGKTSADVESWALVLAAGEGSRLRSLTTTPCGTAVPKQFCSLNGERTLLEDAIVRASAITSAARICTIVAEQHRQWWTSLLAHFPAPNVIAQPCNRGTAIGILYPHSGEAVIAIIVRSDPTLSEADIREHCRSQLTGYKRPRYIRFVEQLPKTAVGKIARGELRDRFRSAINVATGANVHALHASHSGNV